MNMIFNISAIFKRVCLELWFLERFCGWISLSLSEITSLNEKSVQREKSTTPIDPCFATSAAPRLEVAFLRESPAILFFTIKFRA